MTFFKGRLKSGTSGAGPLVVVTSLLTSLMTTSATAVKSVVKLVVNSYGSAGVVVVVVVQTWDVNDIVVGSAVVAVCSVVVISSSSSNGSILSSQICPIAIPSFCAPDHVLEQIASFQPSRPNWRTQSSFSFVVCLSFG